MLPGEDFLKLVVGSILEKVFLEYHQTITIKRGQVMEVFWEDFMLVE